MRTYTSFVLTISFSELASSEIDLKLSIQAIYFVNVDVLEIYVVLLAKKKKKKKRVNLHILVKDTV